MSTESRWEAYLERVHLDQPEAPEAYYTALEFFSAENEAEAQRNIYKYTDCGAWIEFGEYGIVIGSIVEGADFGTLCYPLNYADNFTSTDIQNRIDAIEAEATLIWEWANEPDDTGLTPAEQGCEAPDYFSDYDTCGRSS